MQSWSHIQRRYLAEHCYFPPLIWSTNTEISYWKSGFRVPAPLFKEVLVFPKCCISWHSKHRTPLLNPGNGHFNFFPQLFAGFVCYKIVEYGNSTIFLMFSVWGMLAGSCNLRASILKCIGFIFTGISHEIRHVLSFILIAPGRPDYRVEM